MELVTAYAVLANGGFRVEPYLIREIQDVEGRSLYYAQVHEACPECGDAAGDHPDSELPAAQAPRTGNPDELAVAAPPENPADTIGHPPQPLAAQRVMDERVHYILNSMMKDVVNRGTATRATVLKRPDMGGKTGTTNGPTDAWFSGYTRGVVTTAWLGFDNNEVIGRREFGGSAALPIWIDYMRVALAGQPITQWPQPDGISSVRIDPETGLLARPQQPDAIFEIFRTELVPTEYAQPSVGPSSSGSTNRVIEEDLF
jgi:penicillin-binding protein 1A